MMGTSCPSGSCRICSVAARPSSEVLDAYHWPGNVRELENIIRRTLALTRGKVLTPDELPDEIVSQAGRPGVPGGGSFFQRRAETLHAPDVVRIFIRCKVARYKLFTVFNKPLGDFVSGQAAV